MLDAFLAFSALAYLTSAGALVLLDSRRGGVAAAVVVFGGALGAAWVGMPVAALPAAGVLVASVAVVARKTGLSPVGSVVWAAFLILTVVSAVWGLVFLAGLSLSVPSTALLWIATVVVGITLPSSVVQSYEAWERVLRVKWRRPRQALVPVSPRVAPFVSIHVPIHAEPPAVVIGTLDRLAALRYERFEVIVIDNNTSDPALWQPVERHCSALGSRFRFLHVEGITGAKAGALNYALPRTDRQATVIGVVDADYHVEPDWLERTIGYFADETLGFVQCPHAYRSFENRRFGRMANAEYRVFFETSMAAYNERGAALTVGTMSLIRREALERAGGWATWCLTEDSELAVRIHALGYESVYLTHAFGRGLIPDTFAAYRQQRFRWTYGPVQEVRRHVRLFVPGPGRRPSELDTAQRIHHGNHGLDVALIGVRWIGFLVGAAAATSMALQHEVVRMPLALWVMATAILLASLVMRLHILRSVVRSSWSEIVGAVVAYHALGHVIRMASLRADLGIPAVWRRTDKFPARPGRWPALSSARTETLLGLACLVLAGFGFALLPARGIATMLFVGVALAGLSYLCAPLTALIADRDLRRTPSVVLELAGTAAGDDLLPCEARAS